MPVANLLMTSLAWSNLRHEKIRSAIAVAGVTFAVVLMFMQLGFLAAVENTATIIYDALDFDILIRSPTYLHLSDPRSFPQQRLRQAASFPDVFKVEPFYITINGFQNPTTLQRWSILTMGVRPGTSPFRLKTIARKVQKLTNDASAIIDRHSQAKYGPANGITFGEQDIGRVAEIGNRETRLVDTFELGTGLAANAAVILTDRGFARVTPRRTADQVSLGLVRLNGSPSLEKIEQVASRMAAGLREQKDITVMTREEAIRRERRYWLFDKSIGIIFLMGVAVAVVVGLAIVYQVLSGDVARHLSEYATLKAMGYGNGYLTGVVLKQAILLALAGFFVGWFTALILFAITSEGAGIPIRMDLRILIFVLLTTLAMCCCSGLAALRKAHRAQPADLF